MKKIHFKIAGMLVLLAWTSCEKIDIPDSSYSGLPLGISGKAGEEDLSLGLDQPGVKMITGAEFVEDALWEFTGRLESTGSDGRFLSIQLRNRVEGRDSVIQWESFLSDSLFYMLETGVNKEMYPLRIMTHNAEGFDVYKIQAGDQRKDGIQNETTFMMSNRMGVPVCVEYGNGTLNGKFCSEIVSQPHTQTSFPNWAVISNNHETARLAARLSNGLLIEKYNWGNGDQTSEYLSAGTPGVYEVQMTDVHGRKYSHSKQLLFDNTDGFSTYGNSFQFKAEWQSPVTVTDRKQLRSVAVTYRDRAGVVYVSSSGGGGMNRFKIEDIREYENDARGRPTLAMKVRFSARLFSQSGESILLENCHGWFAVGLP